MVSTHGHSIYSVSDWMQQNTVTAGLTAAGRIRVGLTTAGIITLGLTTAGVITANQQQDFLQQES